MGFSQRGRPLQVVWFGWSRFPVPGARKKAVGGQRPGRPRSQWAKPNGAFGASARRSWLCYLLSAGCLRAMTPSGNWACPAGHRGGNRSTAPRPAAIERRFDGSRPGSLHFPGLAGQSPRRQRPSLIRMRRVLRGGGRCITLELCRSTWKASVNDRPRGHGFPHLSPPPQQDHSCTDAARLRTPGEGLRRWDSTASHFALGRTAPFPQGRLTFTPINTARHR